MGLAVAEIGGRGCDQGHACNLFGVSSLQVAANFVGQSGGPVC